MPPKSAKTSSKKGASSKAGAGAGAGKKAAGGGELETVFSGLNVEVPHDDGGRVATGMLVSEPRARDIKIDAFSLALHGAVLVEDTKIELNNGARYGLVGRNGCGKSTFLKCLAAREVPIPSHFDVYLLAHEAPPSEDTALEYVINSAVAEVARLETMVENIMVEDGPESPLLQDLYDKLDQLDPSTFETRASSILIGLGFKSSASDSEGGATIHKKTKDMSGGWRMRVALAKALFICPGILLLDEPTNVSTCARFSCQNCALSLVVVFISIWIWRRASGLRITYRRIPRS
jgi:ATP-binding cassette subfamily F protein 2